MQIKRLKGGKRISKLVIFLVLLIIYTPGVFPQVKIVAAFPELEFDSPVDLQHPGDGTNRLFVAEQAGKIKVFENSPNSTSAPVFLDISDRVVSGGEMGLLGLAFHPQYETNGYFYVNYTTEINGRRTRISRFSVTSDPDSADERSEYVIMTVTQPYTNHNGGQLAFGPDGYLYIALGDGGGAGDPENNAQDRGTLLGKILRINTDSTENDLNYSIPADNPFKGNQSGYREEIYAYGLRNPWRFSFDTLTSKIWCADVGQDAWEEINLIEPGKNYGWRIKEGDHCFNPPENCDTAKGLVSPVWEYGHSEGSSITGGFVYRGSSVPYLQGKYIYADFVSSKIWALAADGVNPPENTLLLTAPAMITSFGVDQNNEVYILTFSGDGTIYKFTPALSSGNAGEIEERGYLLRSAYPNPFNSTTNLSFKVPQDSKVNIDVLNIAGELVSNLRNEVFGKGEYNIKWNADNITSGTYFIRVTASSPVFTFRRVLKVILMK